MKRSSLPPLFSDALDLELVCEGLKLTIRHSKTDQEGQGQVIAVPAGKVLKPVALLNALLAVRGRAAGHLSMVPMRKAGWPTSPCRIAPWPG
jgi:hypothetical protein